MHMDLDNVGKLEPGNGENKTSSKQRLVDVFWDTANGFQKKPMVYQIQILFCWFWGASFLRLIWTNNNNKFICKNPIQMQGVQLKASKQVRLLDIGVKSTTERPWVSCWHNHMLTASNMTYAFPFP